MIWVSPSLRFWIHLFLFVTSLGGALLFLWHKKKALPPLEVQTPTFRDKLLKVLATFKRRIFLFVSNLNWEKVVHKVLVQLKIFILKIEGFLNQKIYAIRKKVREKEEARRYWESIKRHIYREKPE